MEEVMKKIVYTFLIVVLFLIPLNSFAADTTASGTANVDVFIDQSDRSSDSYDYGSQDYSFPYAGRHDSSSTFAVQPVYNTEKMGDLKGLPQDWARMGWRILPFPERTMAEGIPMAVLDKSRSASKFLWWGMNHEEKDTGYPVIDKANGRVFPVNFFPKDASAYPVRHAKAYAGKEKYLPTEAEYEAIYHGAKSGAKYFLVLYNIHYLSKTENASLGTTIVGNAAVGPSGEVGKRLLSGGGGSGWGSAQSWVWERGGYWVIFLDRMPTPPTPAKPARTKKNAKVAPVQKNIVKKQRAKTPSIMFDQDSSALRSDQLNTVDKIAGLINSMIPDLLKSKRIIRAIGGASREGEYGYNLPLADNRAKIAHKAVAQRLFQKYKIPADKIAKILQHSSIGENYPDFDKNFPDSRNRRVFFVMEDRLTE